MAQKGRKADSLSRTSDNVALSDSSIDAMSYGGVSGQESQIADQKAYTCLALRFIDQCLEKAVNIKGLG